MGGVGGFPDREVDPICSCGPDEGGSPDKHVPDGISDIVHTCELDCFQHMGQFSLVDDLYIPGVFLQPNRAHFITAIFHDLNSLGVFGGYCFLGAKTACERPLLHRLSMSYGIKEIMQEEL
jgi:hypothetical protein